MQQKKQKIGGVVFVLLVALAAAIIALHLTGLLALNAGSAAGNRFAYFLTYAYPSLGLAPATVSVSYAYHDPYGSPQTLSFSSSCTTSRNLVYFGSGTMTELDAPVSASTPSPLQNYYLYHTGNATTCEISLPADYYNQTNGTITFQAAGPAGISNVYTAKLSIASEYSQNQAQVLLFTIPISSSSGSTTITISTTTSTSSTTASTTAATTSASTTTTASSSTTSTICNGCTTSSLSSSTTSMPATTTMYQSSSSTIYVTELSPDQYGCYPGLFQGLCDFWGWFLSLFSWL